MRSRSARFFAIAATAALLAATLAAGSVSASAQRPFHLDKTCAESSEPLGYICTVQDSDFKWIPAGTDVHYLSQDGNVVQARIDTRDGSTSGACTWSSDVDAICVFDTGSGRLEQFNLEVVVTANADQSIGYWDGSYWFGN